MKIEWKNIRDERPGQNSVIIQMDEPADWYADFYKNKSWSGGHWTMGMKEYVAYETWENYLKWCDDNGARIPSYWWVYAKDFPFPVPKITPSSKFGMQICGN